VAAEFVGDGLSFFEVLEQHQRHARPLEVNDGERGH
jgi:hypothetical protein